MKKPCLSLLLLLAATPVWAQSAAKSEDSVHASGHFGSFTLCVRKDTATQLAGTDGDYSPCITDASGRVHVTSNLALINGVTPLMGNGASGTGAQRVTIANDSTGILASVTTVGTVTNITNLPNEGQQTANNSISVTPDTDNDPIGPTGSAVPTKATLIGGKGGGSIGGALTGIPVCVEHAAINISSATTTLLVTGASSSHVYICSINLVTAAANNVAVIAGQTVSTPCDTSPAGLNGGTTAASGWNLGANGTLAHGTGVGAIISTNGPSGAATGDDVCLVTSAATQLSGTVSFAVY